MRLSYASCPVANPGSYQFSVVETAPPGSAVGRLRAHDPDEGENALLAYSILDGGDGAEAFTVHTDALGQDGIITVRKVGGGVPLLTEPWN